MSETVAADHCVGLLRFGMQKVIEAQTRRYIGSADSAPSEIGRA